MRAVVAVAAIIIAEALVGPAVQRLAAVLAVRGCFHVGKVDAFDWWMLVADLRTHDRVKWFEIAYKVQAPGMLFLLRLGLVLWFSFAPNKWI